MPHPALTRTAVITGGASGIGLAVAVRLTEMGLNVCIADRDEEALG
jgi:NAD(P)-dependent dehydrogenase (short-subunit alcohol dehydrogenase family)